MVIPPQVEAHAQYYDDADGLEDPGDHQRYLFRSHQTLGQEATTN
jgi:hypothetical protein